MENQTGHDAPLPPGCFLPEEINTLQLFEKQKLTGVNYYIWHNQPEAGAMPHRFLYALELVFDGAEALLLSSGEDSEAIRLITAKQLVALAATLQRLHSKPVIQRVAAGIQPLWREVVGKSIEAFRLSRNESGLYLNDALLLDFGEHRILVRLAEREGLLAGAF